MSEGSRFVEALRRIGYPAVDSLSGSSLDWMFDHEALVPFLNWFCDEIQPDNVLQPREISMYSELESNGSSEILDGIELDNALRSQSLLSGYTPSKLSDNQLREEVAELEKSLNAAKHRRNVIAWQRDKLALHQSALADRASRLDTAVNSTSKAEYRLCLDQSRLDNAKMNSCMESLTSAVCQLTSQYPSSTGSSTQIQSTGSYSSGLETKKQSSLSTKQSSDAANRFLSDLDFQAYHDTEEAFSRELTNFTKKQFFEGIAEMVGQTDGSRYSLLEIRDPASLLVQGEQESVMLEDCKDLARLQSFYPVSECKRIDAQREECRMMSALDFHEQMNARLKDNPYPTDVTTLSARLRETQSILGAVNKDVSHLADVKIPALIKESAALMTVSILRGDYDLKITRQDYFTSNQDKLISELIVQRSRNELLTMALELELRGHKDVHKLLTAIGLLLTDMNSSCSARMKFISELEQTSDRIGRSTIDSRDKFLLRLHDILCLQVFNSSDQQHSNKESNRGDVQRAPLFVSYSQLAKAAEGIGHQVAAHKASSLSANQRADERLTVLEESLGCCESVMYAENNVGSQSTPVLSPRPISEAIFRLNSVLNSLEKAVIDIMKDVELKNKTLREDRYQSAERQLFVQFFNNPDKLRRLLTRVNGELQDLSVK